MDESPTDCWTNHHSLVEYKGQWYLFYHHNDYSPNSIKTDRHGSIPYSSTRTALSKSNPYPARSGHNRRPERNSTGSLQPVKQSGAAIDYLNQANKFEGWKTLLSKNGAWVQYNRVNFGDSTPESESKSNLGQRRNTANTYKRNKWSGYLGNKSSQNR